MAKLKPTTKLKPQLVKLDNLCSQSTSWGFDQFKVGYSVLIKNEAEMLKARNAAYAYAKRNKVTFQCLWSPKEKGWRLIRK